MIESISFQPGNWGASYGRSIGGLVQAEVRSPSKSGLHGYIDLSTFDLSAMVETPRLEGLERLGGRPPRPGRRHPALRHQDLRARRRRRASASRWRRSTSTTSCAPSAKATSKSRLFISLYGSSDRYAFINPNPFIDPATEGNQGSAGNVDRVPPAHAGLRLPLLRSRHLHLAQQHRASINTSSSAARPTSSTGARRRRCRRASGSASRSPRRS